MAALTKTQINYFCDKLNIICQRVVNAVEDELKEKGPKSMTSLEKAELICSGKAEPNYELLMQKGKSGFGLGNTVDAFTFPGECEKEIEVQQFQKKLKELVKIIRKDADRLKDDFVLGRFVDPDVVVNEFEGRKEHYIRLFDNNMYNKVGE